MDPFNRMTSELVDQARRGNEAAFAALIRDHAPRLLRLAHGILGDQGAAEDAVQEALLSAWRGMSGFRDEAALATWLNTITVRTCRREVDHRRTRDSWTTAQQSEHDWEDPDYSVDPVSVLARSAHRVELLSALGRLPGPYRIAVLLHDVEGLSAAKVAAVMRSPLGTAKTRIRRGRAALVSALADPVLVRASPDPEEPRS